MQNLSDNISRPRKSNRVPSEYKHRALHLDQPVQWSNVMALIQRKKWAHSKCRTYYFFVFLKYTIFNLVAYSCVPVNTVNQVRKKQVNITPNVLKIVDLSV
jgi:hypothetical protein